MVERKKAMSNTLREWLRAEIRGVLTRKQSSAPLIIWFDPRREWRELLRLVIDGEPYELWADEAHELALRESLRSAPNRPRILWLPRSPDEITFLKPVELEADAVWVETLVESLRRFGVHIPGDRQKDYEALPAHAREWIDRPASDWRDLTPGLITAELVDEDCILEVLAGQGRELSDLLAAERIPVFARRVVDDYGLPSPADVPADEWRRKAMASLLCTEAAARVPASPLTNGDKAIAEGPRRDLSLRLLRRWLDSASLSYAFEGLSEQADRTTGLAQWARALEGDTPALASRAAESELFRAEADRLDKLDEFNALTAHLERREAYYTAHADGYRGSRAERLVPWRALVDLARAGIVLRREAAKGDEWRTPADALSWFIENGYEADSHGEDIFRDTEGFPPQLHAVRARLRRAYLRHLDQTNGAFADQIHRHGVDALGLPFAGEAAAEYRSQREPIVVLVLDALRFDLAKRLASRLNRGEPKIRAEVRAARAPLPSITALGMPFALASDPRELKVQLTADKRPEWQVTTTGTSANLATAGGRREWLAQRYKVKADAIVDIRKILDDPPPAPRKAGRTLVAFGDELDKQGHADQLELAGAEAVLQRYTRVIGRLREAGWPTIVVVTDHGYFHWQPEADEKLLEPEGELLWKSRRAVVGRDLKHPSALATGVPQSDLECLIPRSVGAFLAYGGMGYFHGGATLQELVIPVLVARWPKKTEKVPAVLVVSPMILSLNPRIEVNPGVIGMFEEAPPGDHVIGRHVTLRIVDPGGGRVVFRHDESVKLEPAGEPVLITLAHVTGSAYARGTVLRVEVRDADNEELLDSGETKLGIDIEEYD